jgi:hypothetical protein
MRLIASQAILPQTEAIVTTISVASYFDLLNFSRIRICPSGPVETQRCFPHVPDSHLLATKPPDFSLED